MRATVVLILLVFSSLYMASCGPQTDDNNNITKGRNDAIETLIAQYPDSAELLNQFASAVLEKGDTAKSIQLLSQSLGIKLDQPSVENELGFLLAAIKSEQALLIATRMTKSEKALTAAQGHYIKGLYHANTGNDKEAIRSFDSSIISNFTFTDAYIEKAILLYSAGDFDKAIEALSKAMELDRKNPDVYFWMGNCLEEKKDIEKASAFYQEAIRLDPQHQGAITSFNNIKKQ